MFWLVTCLCHWTWSELLFWEVLRTSEWRSRLAAATGDAAVLTGLDFHPGWSQLLPPPKSPHISFLWCCSWGQRVEGRLCEQGCARHGRAQSHLCSFLCSATATAGSERPGFLCQAPARACPVPPQTQPRCQAGGQSFSVHAVPLVPLMTSIVCPSLFLKATYQCCLREDISREVVSFLSPSLPPFFFFLFFSFRLFGLFCELVGWGFFFLPKCSFPLLEILNVLFTVVAIMLSSPEPEIRSYTWKKSAGLSVPARKN